MRPSQSTVSVRSASECARCTVRVLVVEDDKQLAAALRRGLEPEGYGVDIALNGTDGEWFATENGYDAMVMNVMLPGLAGDVLCARRRDSGDWTPILMLTARSGREQETRALDAGAGDFLSKPFSFMVLAARLGRLERAEVSGEDLEAPFGWGVDLDGGVHGGGLVRLRHGCSPVASVRSGCSTRCL
jgi:DNA-binding response OmpR family regulator